MAKAPWVTNHQHQYLPELLANTIEPKTFKD